MAPSDLPVDRRAGSAIAAETLPFDLGLNFFVADRIERALMRIKERPFGGFGGGHNDARPSAPRRRTSRSSPPEAQVDRHYEFRINCFVKIWSRAIFAGWSETKRGLRGAGGTNRDEEKILIWNRP